MILTKTYGFKIALARGQLDLSLGGTASLAYRFTTSASPLWTTTLSGPFPLAAVADTFGSKAVAVISAGINATTGKYEVGLADLELTADGGDTAFSHVFLTETASFRPLCYWSPGVQVNVPDGQTLRLELNDANGIAFDFD